MISGGTVTRNACIAAAAVVALIICFFPGRSYPSATVVLEADRQFAFAEDLFQRGEYYRAIGEYERFIHFFPDAKRVVLARYRIGLAYLKGERYGRAVDALGRVIEQHPRSGYADKSRLQMSEAFVKLKRYDEAVETLESLIATTHDRDTRDKACYECGWIYIEKGLWEDAEACFNKISPQNRRRFRIDHLLKQLDEGKDLKRKSPAAAGMLAVLPGAGHVYCGRYRDALAAFLVNGALILAACEAFDNELYALGGLITVVEFGFYTGNIYSAVSSAHKYNRHRRTRFQRYLEERARIKFSLAGPRHGEAVMVSCKLLF